MFFKQGVVLGQRRAAADGQALGHLALGLEVFRDRDVAQQTALLVAFEKGIDLFRETDCRGLRCPCEFAVSSQRNAVNDSKIWMNLEGEFRDHRIRHRVGKAVRRDEFDDPFGVEVLVDAF